MCNWACVIQSRAGCLHIRIRLCLLIVEYRVAPEEALTDSWLDVAACSCPERNAYKQHTTFNHDLPDLFRYHREDVDKEAKIPLGVR